jgi:hypothetical protein
MFRFTIRDVLWLTVVVALGVAWVMERNKAIHARTAAIQSWDASLTPELLEEYLREYGEKRDDRPVPDYPPSGPPNFILPPPPDGYAWAVTPDGSELFAQPTATPNRP